ncbi:YARHG domain-containing protein [Legionella maceachernii]|uniref:YARHG domain-containing protein n=1 Tax=Legionella maceachernii TaxID=466 RepID=A0A0W0VVS3_9GAMM|nr:YARHG domain-containing protein [Legionella maceachernii]KTD24152.1 hypothetical protein Lmac_3025 [Legionella maceachernii]SJZ87488.1 YARHG domain-containing protein [Legionella maceachernii]SUO98932.1 Uncharacterised protein [Legionella maceachernii]
MNRSAQTVLTLLLLIQSLISSANDTEFGGNGSLPIPLENKAIGMIAEVINIYGDDLPNPNRKGRWLYHCQFTFKNFTSKKQTLQMGFPFPIYNEEEAIAVPKGLTSYPGNPLVYEFKVSTPEGPVPAVRSKIGANKDKDLAYQDAYLWPMTFAPNQTLQIEHSYSTGVTNDVMGFTWISYVLKTGALWRGNQIGHTRILISPNTPTRLCSEISSYKDIGTPMPGMKIIKKGAYHQYLWDLKHFEPKQDVTLCLQTGRDYVRYQLVYPLIGISSYPLPSLSNLSRAELRRMKNSIFAQYGRIFNDPELQHYFDTQWWYEPNPDYQENQLTKEDKEALKVLNAVIK